MPASWWQRHRVLAVILALVALLIYSQVYNIFGFDVLLPSPTLVALALLALWILPARAIHPNVATPISHAGSTIEQKIIEDQAVSEQKVIEAELDETDHEGIGKVIRLSSLELKRFYSLSIGQTQGSYRWALLASWLGLLVILAGVLELFGILGPLTHAKSQSSSLATPTNSLVTISAGAVVELVSVLFLSVYRSANRRFSYFYDRQMHLYSILMAYRMSAGMKNPDSCRQTIIKEIATRIWSLEEEQRTRFPKRVRGRSQNGYPSNSSGEDS